MVGNNFASEGGGADEGLRLVVGIDEAVCFTETYKCVYVSL